MDPIFIASHNVHKVEEFRQLLTPLQAEVRPLPTGLPDCPEDAHSFEANALEKAVFYSRWCAGWVLADDSGLCVDALQGEPGIHSARYSGVHGDDAANNRKLLQALAGTPDEQRTAVFVCALAVWSGTAQTGFVVRGEVRGRIAHAPRGRHGFGYDPLFILPAKGCTMAELLPAEKQQVSHRAVAVRRLLQQWGVGR
ncbi:MAG: RdgB/HAM1 family non-canonical purine NTP pyrophosphatase [Alicyclobacillus sp.]|nr:RdgB/HAM1 family non-canonical purine NTP pyrophosphatase [Alicyclobacillus sp.]